MVVEARLGSGDGERFDFIANGFHASAPSWVGKNSMLRLATRCNERVTPSHYISIKIWA
jgi:hypothetical protein